MSKCKAATAAADRSNIKQFNSTVAQIFDG